MGTILLTDAFGKTSKIDVKATAKDVNGYTGKRIRSEIIYDLIKISNRDVILIPDTNSPLQAFGILQRIGLFSNLYELWREARSQKKQFLMTQEISLVQPAIS